MRLASFLFLSITIHALALAYPISFAKPKDAELIKVTILPIEGEAAAGADNTTSGGTPAPKALNKSSTSKASPAQHIVESKPNSDAEPQSQLITTLPDLVENPSATLVWVPSKPNEQETNSATKNSSTHDGNGNDVGGVRGNGNGLASSGTGGGLGNGASGNGTGATVTQARYRETPKPIYPESARQQGREGRVLLRVLVDDQGRAKAVEINKSSGDDSLDRADGEAIKRWRFIPAHYGDKAVESWIRIPVDFRLADANSGENF